jgi:hypothetical protein
MFEFALWIFAAIGLAFTGYQTVRLARNAIAWAARRKEWGKETRVITITRLIAGQELIDYARDRREPHEDINFYAAVEGTLWRNNGSSEEFYRTVDTWNDDGEQPSALAVLRTLAGQRDYLPAVDFRSAKIEIIAAEEAQVAA